MCNNLRVFGWVLTSFTKFVGLVASSFFYVMCSVPVVCSFALPAACDVRACAVSCLLALASLRIHVHRVSCVHVFVASLIRTGWLHVVAIQSVRIRPFSVSLVVHRLHHRLHLYV